MSIQEVVRALKTVAPVYYMAPKVDENNPRPTLPFIAYVPSQSSFIADNTNYHKENQYTFEYYFELKDPTKEDALESKLNELGFVFEKSEDQLIEDMYVIYYTT